QTHTSVLIANTAPRSVEVPNSDPSRVEHYALWKHGSANVSWSGDLSWPNSTFQLSDDFVIYEPTCDDPTPQHSALKLLFGGKPWVDLRLRGPLRTGHLAASAGPPTNCAEPSGIDWPGQPFVLWLESAPTAKGVLQDPDVPDGPCSVDLDVEPARLSGTFDCP